VVVRVGCPVVVLPLLELAAVRVGMDQLGVVVVVLVVMRPVLELAERAAGMVMRDVVVVVGVGDGGMGVLVGRVADDPLGGARLLHAAPPFARYPFKAAPRLTDAAPVVAGVAGT
jgi:hypothetical protein